MTALLTETQRENQDTRLIPLSALQHYAFCPRQCFDSQRAGVGGELFDRAGQGTA
ncbi:CRISPR-associated protein Cas4 [Neisseria gonorrhoeae]|nr:CRISPR-associated protein Cas4 [Neisseria gonorrhoeae]BBH59341.1 CRISPR-associated protein Cas4 [Neisseria gonorrhoeae]BBH61618.1 CRISPR-associated protein Cas4 [Neisseria gonorrhoeae]